MTVVHFEKELASYKLRAIKSVKLSSNLASMRLTCVTVSHFYKFRLRTEPLNSWAGWIPAGLARYQLGCLDTSCVSWIPAGLAGY
jgi:hypothetical protein